MMSIALGTLPDWIAGVSTSGALVAAGFAAKAAFGQVQHLRDQVAHTNKLEEDRQRAEHRSQASQIAVWIESDGRVPRIFFGNRSSLPIYGVTVVCQVLWLNRVVVTSYSALGPTSEPRDLFRVRANLERVQGDELFEPIRTNRGLGIAIESPEIREGSELLRFGSDKWADLVANHVNVGVAFRDTNEISWVRHPHGDLTEHGMLGAATAHLIGDWELADVEAGDNGR
jgi:hypothetical protein